MNAPQKILVDTETELKMQAALQAQRDSYIAEGEVSAATRIDRIDRAINVLVKHSEAISET
ncbi:coniferyl aldehyde dehydrogenase, partial [Porticoccaceae bacterium]|nr:coniferyl aldehyde dehydrogenase [Porticoccaceae bacterium]